MINFRALVLFTLFLAVLFLAASTRRIISDGNSQQHQINTRATALEASADAREAFNPQFLTSVLNRRGQQAGASTHAHKLGPQMQIPHGRPRLNLPKLPRNRSRFSPQIRFAESGGESPKALSIDTLPKRIINAEYAVRGEVLTRANEIQEMLDSGNHSFPFDALVPCHIGNPQQVGATPVSFHREMLSLLSNPDLIGRTDYAPDVVERAKVFLRNFPKMGAYSESRGVKIFREYIARYIAQRDGTDEPNVDNLFITDGASSAIQTVLEMLIRDSQSGILVPIPQYPLYSGTIVRLGGQIVGYNLVEEDRWSLSIPVLEAQLASARASNLTVKGMVVINPGNPTGNVLTRDTMEAVVRFCEREGIALLADEVYQDNIYQKDRPFISFRSVVLAMNSSVELFSFHSISKGFYGECGLRSGYAELLNIDRDVNEQFYKLRSMGLCSNTLGQAMMASILTPPPPGSPSLTKYAQERTAKLESLQRKAIMIHKVLNDIDGVSTQPIDGAMYAFVKVDLPQRYIELAEAAGRAPDLQYCLDLLEATGVVVVPGSGFGQEEGTYHFRITILPQESTFGPMLDRIKAFHLDLLNQHQ